MLCSKKIIITGANGLIGKEALEVLTEKGFKVFAIVRTIQENNKNIEYIKCDLFDDDQLKQTFETIRPEYLLHFAWDTQAGYLESDSNYKLLDSSLKMLEYFNINGGKKAVYAGTCFEYKFRNTPIKETDELSPANIYAKCKNELREKAEEYCKNNDLAFGWGRIFYVYGNNEHPNRLTQSIINNFKAKKSVEINCGNLIRDYMYSKDIAAAFVEFLISNVTGCLNICSGEGISLSDYAIIFAKAFKNEEALSIKDSSINQPPVIIGDNSKLINEVKYKIKYSLNEGIKDILKGEA